MLGARRRQNMNTDNHMLAKCKSCGAPILPGDAFCTVCGQPVGIQANVPAPQVNQGIDGLCPSCGEPLVPGDKFCIKCGRPIRKEGDPGRVANDASPRDPRPMFSGPTIIDYPDTPQNAPADNNPIGYCTQCGHPLYDGDLFCTSCSAPVSAKESHDSRDSAATLVVTSDLPPSSSATTIMRPARNASAPQADYPGPNTSYEDDDDPTVRSQLVTITLEEARNGCTKKLRLGDGTEVQVDVPAGANPGTKVDIPGMGIVDKTTGRRGPLRVSFYIMR